MHINGDVLGVFQSTPPRREVTPAVDALDRSVLFQSTPPRREVTVCGEVARAGQVISIHTSPKGGDRKNEQNDPYSRHLAHVQSEFYRRKLILNDA